MTEAKADGVLRVPGLLETLCKSVADLQSAAAVSPVAHSRIEGKL